jgi:hypothetical protein
LKNACNFYLLKISFDKNLLMKYTFLILAICVCGWSCKKDSNSGGDKTQLLTSADWKYDNGGIGDANGNILFDFSTLGVAIPSCLLDNTVKFNTSGNGTVSENTNVCSGAQATSNFTWNLSSDQTLLNVSGGIVAGISGSFKIKTLSSSKLTLLKDTTLSGVGSGTAVFNLKH